MNQPPPLPEPTHEPLDMMSLFQMVQDLRSHSEDGILTHDKLKEVASSKDVPVSHAYAAMVFDPGLAIDAKEPLIIAICAGRCQLFGAIPLLEHLIETKEARATAGEGGFDIVPRNCLDQCDYPPIMISRSPAGICSHRYAKIEDANELIEALAQDS